MSTEESQPVRPASSNRRRRNPKADQETTEPAPKREYPQNIPVSADKIGQTLVGVIHTVVKRGRNTFGFVTLGTELGNPTDASTRVYFSPGFINNGSKILLRRGYAVEFTVSVDAKDRQVATILKLTEEGVATMTAREAAIALKRAEAAKEPKEETKPKIEVKAEKKEKVETEKKEKTVKADKPKRERKPRNVTLKIKSASGEEKTVEINLNQPIGKLKLKTIEALAIEGDFSLYLGDEFLTKKLFKKLSDTDTVVVGPKKEKVEVEDSA